MYDFYLISAIGSVLLGQRQAAMAATLSVCRLKSAQISHNISVTFCEFSRPAVPDTGSFGFYKRIAVRLHRDDINERCQSTSDQMQSVKWVSHQV